MVRRIRDQGEAMAENFEAAEIWDAPICLLPLF